MRIEHSVVINGNITELLMCEEITVHVDWKDDGEQESLSIKITDEGIIVDAFDDSMDDPHSWGMTFLELHQFVSPKPVNLAIARLQAKYGDCEPTEDLDEEIIEQYAQTAASVNNEGVCSQIEALVQHVGEEEAENILYLIYGQKP